MLPGTNRPLGQVAGFTLIEILVSITLLAILLLIIVSMAGNTASVSSISLRKISAESGARQTLDRMSADFSLAAIRPDLSQKIGKQGSLSAPGNDEIAFHAQAEGYVGDRGVSRVGYRIPPGTNQLLRGSQGLYWEGGASRQIDWGTTNFIPIDPVTSAEVLGKDIFRFELAFVMSDGTFRGSVDSFQPGPGGVKVAAVIVGVAALDSRAGFTIAPEDLLKLFPDAVPGRDLLSLWRDEMSKPGFGSSIPSPARSGIRIFQRTFPIRQ